MAARKALILGILALVGASPAAVTPASAHDFWIQMAPETPEEVALRDAIVRGAFGGAQETVDRLRGVSASHPGTAASGLARLAAGLALVAADRPSEAVPFLTHEEIQLTTLGDHALLALGRALEPRDPARAADAFLTAARSPALACDALFAAADASLKARQPERVVEAMTQALAACPGQEPRALQALGAAHDARGDRPSAAEAFDRLDRDYPTSAEARDSASRLHALRSFLPPVGPEDRAARLTAKGLALAEAGRHRDAVAVLRSVPLPKLAPEDAARVRVRLGRSLFALRRRGEGEAALRGVPAESSWAAEAAYFLARSRVGRGGSIQQYESVAQQFAGTPWGEEALLALANHHQKDNRDAEALPFYRRLLEGYPDGRHVERAAWRVAWAEIRAGRCAEAAPILERTARLRPTGSFTPGFVYWAGRCRVALGEGDRARQLFSETVQRFKNTYHGMRAREALARLPPGDSAVPSYLAGTPEPLHIPEPQQTRIRQLLLVDLLDEAGAELRLLPPSPKVQATLAWIDWRRGRLRPAIIAMKKAYPEYLGEAGDRLPDEIWRIIYPIQYAEVLKAKAEEEDLDPALVAAIICQESTFEAAAVSRAGARGLMQVIPATGRQLARDLGVRYRRTALHNPVTSLDFGTRYLRRMMERFDGRLERVLAAYNAGPHRVDAWTAGRPDLSAEEFIESIPFTETRGYVMTILASHEHYRRLYALEKRAVAPAAAGGAS